MPIVVKHSGAAAPTAVASYGGGQAKRNVADAPGILRVGENRKARIERENTRLAAQVAASNASRAARRQAPIDAKAKTDAETLKHERDLELIGARTDGRSQADGQDEDPNFEVGFSDTQRQEYNQITDSIDKIKNDPNLTEEDKAEAIDKQMQRRQAIENSPSRSMKAKSPYLPGRGVGESWQDDSGNTWVRDSKGIPSVEVEFDPEAERKRRSDEYDADFNRYTTRSDDGEEEETDFPAMMKFRAQREAILSGTYSPSDDTGGLDGNDSSQLDPEQSAALPDKMQIEAGQQAREARLAQTERKDQHYMIRTTLSEAPAAVGETKKLAAEAARNAAEENAAPSASAPKMDAKDQKMLTWAIANPSDPKAQRVLQVIQSKYRIQ